MSKLIASKLLFSILASNVRASAVRIVTGRAANPVEKIIEQALFELIELAFRFIRRMTSQPV